jgi:hypothetical protein
VAGEIGIEPMASCASDRRSTQPELLADLSCEVDLAGLEPTASALQVRCSPELSYRPKVPAAYASRVFNYARTGVNSSERPMRTASMRISFISPREKKKRARIGTQQIESNESSPCLRSSEDANNVGASVPPLRAGHGEMKARVDCGYADPPCVSALLCRFQERSTTLVLGGGRRNRTFSSLAGLRLD